MATTVSEDGERIIKLAMIGQAVCDAVQEAGLMVPRRKPGRKVHRQRAAAPEPAPAPAKKERDRKGERERRKARERAERQAAEQRNARQGLPVRREVEEPEDE